MTDAERRLWLIGDAIVDVTLGEGSQPAKLRFGGVMHAARGLWAAGIPYAIAYVAPGYVARQFEDFAAAHDAVSCVRVGEVEGSPNVLVVREPTEAGPQGYELLLRDEKRVSIDAAALRAALADADDVLMFADAATWPELAPLGSDTKAALHLDADLGPRDIAAALPHPLTSWMVSTSANVFHTDFEGNPGRLAESALTGACEQLLFKENRGGARLLRGDRVLEVGAHVRPIVHSVGVGDCFDACFLALRPIHGDEVALAYAAALAADYAASTDPDILATTMRQTLALKPEDVVALETVRLPWEARTEHSIYVAAPDFDWVDRRPLDALVDALNYHGFRPRLPIRENGQLPVEATAAERRRVLDADLQLLSNCEVLIAVLLYDDPGTFVEAGLAAERGLPVIVYDPFERARNPMVRDLPQLVSPSLDEVVGAVFEQVSRLR